MKKSSIIIFILPIIFVAMYFNITYKKPYFETEKFMSNIKTLSSPEYEGRLTGTDGGDKAANYIENEFRKMNLTSLYKDKSYIQHFSVNSVQLAGECSLRAYDSKGNLFKDYVYGKDFKEVPFGKASSGSFTGKVSTSISDKTGLLLFENDMMSESEMDYTLDDTLMRQGVKSVIYTTSSDFNFRTPYKLQREYEDGLIKIMVPPSVKEEMLSLTKMGVTFEVKSNTSNKTSNGKNIVGLIKGKNETLPPIILSAHFDHVGYDNNGVFYPGALDNASGTSFLIECAKLLKNINPERNIIIAAFDAEEVGLLGSKYFAENPPINIKGAININFDMVGSSEDLPLSVLSNKENPLSNKIEKIIKSCGYKSNKIYMDNSDHASFEEVGIDAVTLIHEDGYKIHSPYDTISNIKEEKIIEVFATLKGFLTYNGIIDDKNFNIHPYQDSVNFYSKFILLSFITLIFLNVLLFIKRKG